MKIYDKIKSMSPTETAQFISDLLCGNLTDLINSFDKCLCTDCSVGGLLADGEIHDCDYSNGNCSDINRVKKWLESEVDKNV